MGITFWPTTWFKHVFASLQGWLVVAFDLVVSVGDENGVVGVPSEGSLQKNSNFNFSKRFCTSKTIYEIRSIPST